MPSYSNHDGIVFSIYLRTYLLENKAPQYTSSSISVTVCAAVNEFTA